MISQDTQWASKKDSQSHIFVCFVLVSVVLVVVVVFIVFVVVLIFLTTSITTTTATTTTTTTITTWFAATFTTQHTLNYGTSGGGCVSDIGWVVMVVVMVRYWWCWWSSDGGAGNDGCFNGGSYPYHSMVRSNYLILCLVVVFVGMVLVVE